MLHQGWGIFNPSGELLEVGVVVRVGRGAAAEEAEVLGGGDGVPMAGGDEDGVARVDIAGLAVDLDEARAIEDEVELLADLVVVALGGGAGLNRGFGEALFLDRGVCEVQNASDLRTIFRYKRSLRFEIENRHTEHL